jgi:outer membrane receptor protein involved in Fe transport
MTQPYTNVSGSERKPGAKRNSAQLQDRAQPSRKCMSVIIVLAALMCVDFGGPTTVLAQGKPPQEISTDDIFVLMNKGSVTTATKTERLLKTAPLAVTVITRQQLDEIGAVTIVDALRLVPGMNTRLSPMGYVFGIRSLGATPFSSRVLILVNGAPYNSPDKGGLSGHPEYEDFFPIEYVKRIEVVKGPGSALYGQNAFQGVINIITNDAKDFTGTYADVFGGSRDTAQLRFSHGGTLGDLSYSFTGKAKRQEGPMEFQRGSVIKNGEAYLDVRYKGLTASYLLDRDTSDPFLFSNVATLGTKQKLNVVTASYEKRLAPQWSSTLKVLYNRRDGNTCANCHDPTGGGTIINDKPATPDLIRSEHETNQRMWINEQINWSPASSLHSVVFGGEYQFDRTTKNIAQRLDSQPNVSTGAVFGQDEMSFLDRRVIATVGGRLDRNEITGTAASPTASVVYVPQEKLVLRTSIGRAFRQPTWNDLFINQRFLPSAIPFAGIPTEFRRVGNPALRPEHVSTVEAGAEYFINEAYSIKLDAFHSSIQDYIDAEGFSTQPVGTPTGPPRPPAIGPGPPARLALAMNRVTPIRTGGGEIEFRAKPSHAISGIVSYAYQQHNLDPSVDSQAAYVPKHKVTGIITVNPIERLSINFDVNSWSRFNSASAGLTLGLSSSAPGGILFGKRVGEPYAIANLNINYQFAPKAKSGSGIAFQVRNLFDKAVQENPVPALDTSLRGREFFAKLYYKF